MKDKVESTDNIDDYDEDIPFPENWKRESLESMKNSICDWIDHNVKHEYITNPDIFSEEDETRLYFKIHEKGGSDKEYVLNYLYYKIPSCVPSKIVENPSKTTRGNQFIFDYPISTYIYELFIHSFLQELYFINY